MKKTILLLTIFCLTLSTGGFTAEIIFSGHRHEQFDLFKVDTGTASITQLTNTETDEIMPCVSPDRSMIAFISDRQGANSVYLAPANAIDQAKYVSASVGAYANPKFSLDGSKLLVRYSPDPEALLQNTQIVVLDYEKLQQQVIIDSRKLTIPANSETIAVVDWPLWVSDSLIVYVLAELADEVSGRLTNSTLYVYDLKNRRHIRVGGGESYFTGTGSSMGFKATMPTLIEESPGFKYVAFTAIRGNVAREAMQLSLTGAGKGVLAFNDANFFGPVLFAANTWIYGTIDDTGNTGISCKIGGLSAAPQQLKFDGAVIYPALLAP